jgi:hypothetical protein
VSDSILTSIKKLLGIAEEFTDFDVDILMNINGVFSTLHQLGVGPAECFFIEDATPTWDDFLDGDARLNSVKTYIWQKVRLAFDAPQTGYLVESLKEQIREAEWRLNVVGEGDRWVPTTV